MPPSSENVVIVYHSRAWELYEGRWLARFVDSIMGQSADCDIVELDYSPGGQPEPRLFLPDSPRQTSFIRLPLATHADAQNWLLEFVFQLGYRFAFNTNVDDYYDPNRIAVQREFLDRGFRLVASEWESVDAEDRVFGAPTTFARANLRAELERGHNIICHPSVAYSREFWEGGARYQGDEIPEEDLRLWQREVAKGGFVIAPQVLTFHRWHSNGVCERSKRGET